MKKVAKTILILLVLFTCNSKAQQMFNLTNNKNCSIKIAYEIGDPPSCPNGGGNTPCSSGTVIIPANSSISLAACGNGVLGEVCIDIMEIDGNPISNGHTERVQYVCCMAGNTWSGANPASCGGGLWFVSRTNTSWTLN